MEDLKDKVALVTGAGKGVGRAIAQAFARHGAIVAANDITPVNLDETIASILAEGGRARDYVFDIAKRMPVRALVDQVVADWGRIDMLVNSASVAPQAALLELDEWDWHRTLDVNLSGPFYTMQAVARIMSERNGGVIINLAHDLGNGGDVSQRAAFIASKYGLVGLTRAAARALAAHQIRVVMVIPFEAQDTIDLPAEEALVRLPQDIAAGSQGIAQLVLQLCSRPDPGW